MRFVINSFAVGLPVVSRAALTVATAFFVGLPCAINVAFSDEPAQADWLKCNEHGEPDEATLADGTALKLPTYGDEYQAFRTAPPVDGVKAAQAVVDYERDRLGTNWGCQSLRLDVAGRKIYWMEIGLSDRANVASAGLNGENSQRLLKLDFQQPHGLAVDHGLRKFYWSSHAKGKEAAFGNPADARTAVWQADLDGSKPHPLFSALTEPGGIAVNSTTKTVFYFDGLRLMRGDADGRNEAVVIDQLVLPFNGSLRGYRGSSATIDDQHNKIYWSGPDGLHIARANLDGSEFEVVFNQGDYSGVALDLPNDKMYWAAGKNGELWRANPDGSQPELIAFGMKGPGAIAIDSEHGYLYWRDSKLVGRDAYLLIRRLKRPSLPVAEVKPAPPQITSIDPLKQHAGGTVAVRGQHFTGITNVRIVGDDGRQSEAKFKLASDGELTFIVPPRRRDVKHAAIVLHGPGGVAVTLPRDTSVVKRGDREFTSYDRSQDAAKFCFTVSPDAWFTRVERSLVYLPAGARALPEGRGNVVLFLKDGAASGAGNAAGVVIYHEPFARITRRAKVEGDHKYIPVPAIRPSFVESLLDYE